MGEKGGGGGKWGRRGREVGEKGERGRELGMGYPPVHPLNIGITHVFSCINICLVWRKIFRLSVQTSSEEPGIC